MTPLFNYRSKQYTSNMKRFLLILILWTGSNFAGNSQATKDTICIAFTQAQKILAAARQRDVLLQEQAITEQRIANFQSIIRDLQEKDKITVATYEAEIKVMKEQLSLTVDAIADKNKEIRKIKRKLFFTKAGAAAVIGVVGYLYITK